MGEDLFLLPVRFDWRLPVVQLWGWCHPLSWEEEEEKGEELSSLSPSWGVSGGFHFHNKPVGPLVTRRDFLPTHRDWAVGQCQCQCRWKHTSPVHGGQNALGTIYPFDQWEGERCFIYAWFAQSFCDWRWLIKYREKFGDSVFLLYKNFYEEFQFFFRVRLWFVGCGVCHQLVMSMCAGEVSLWCVSLTCACVCVNNL